MSARPTLVIATTNRGKLQEFRELLAGLPIDLLSLTDFPALPEVIEDGTTYLENARHKALSVAQATGLAALADDSGLEVDALQGAPGVHSARYAGPTQNSQANTEKLLAALHGVSDRGARFRCVIVVAHPAGGELVAEGTCAGKITEVAHGTQGFGYDPIFLYEPAGRTFADMASAEKQRASHRARACEHLREQLVDFIRKPIAALHAGPPR